MTSPGKKTTWTSTYDGVVAQWKGTVDATAFSYTLVPDNGVLTAAEVYASFYDHYSSHADQSHPLRCDTVPAAISVTLGSPDDDAPTGYQRQYLSPARNNVRMWTNLSVEITEGGIVVFR